jgi:hypothetical protein
MHAVTNLACHNRNNFKVFDLNDLAYHTTGITNA